MLDARLCLGLGQLGLHLLLGDGLGDVDDQGLGVGDQGRPLRQLDGAGQDLGAGRQALDGDDEALRDVGGLGLDGQGGVVDGDDGLRCGLALDVDGDVDRHLLAQGDDDEVDVLDEPLDRVALHVLGQGQVLLALDVQGEHGVLQLQRHHRVVTRQGQVDRGGPVAVEDGRHLVGAADPAGSALAELAALLGDDLAGVGHLRGLRDSRGK